MAITETQQKAAAKAFVEYWKDKGYEKGESQKFWLSLLRDVFGVAEPEKFITFEDQVKLDSSTGFIDGYIAETKVRRFSSDAFPAGQALLGRAAVF